MSGMTFERNPDLFTCNPHPFSPNLPDSFLNFLAKESGPRSGPMSANIVCANLPLGMVVNNAMREIPAQKITWHYPDDITIGTLKVPELEPLNKAIECFNTNNPDKTPLQKLSINNKFKLSAINDIISNLEKNESLIDIIRYLKNLVAEHRLAHLHFMYTCYMMQQDAKRKLSPTTLDTLKQGLTTYNCKVKKEGNNINVQVIVSFALIQGWEHAPNYTVHNPHDVSQKPRLGFLASNVTIGKVPTHKNLSEENKAQVPESYCAPDGTEVYIVTVNLNNGLSASIIPTNSNDVDPALLSKFLPREALNQPTEHEFAVVGINPLLLEKASSVHPLEGKIGTTPNEDFIINMTQARVNDGTLNLNTHGVKAEFTIRVESSALSRGHGPRQPEIIPEHKVLMMPQKGYHVVIIHDKKNNPVVTYVCNLNRSIVAPSAGADADVNASRQDDNLHKKPPKINANINSVVSGQLSPKKLNVEFLEISLAYHQQHNTHTKKMQEERRASPWLKIVENEVFHTTMPEIFAKLKPYVTNIAREVLTAIPSNKTQSELKTFVKKKCEDVCRATDIQQNPGFLDMFSNLAYILVDIYLSKNKTTDTALDEAYDVLSSMFAEYGPSLITNIRGQISPLHNKPYPYATRIENFYVTYLHNETDEERSTWHFKTHLGALFTVFSYIQYMRAYKGPANAENFAYLEKDRYSLNKMSVDFISAYKTICDRFTSFLANNLFDFATVPHELYFIIFFAEEYKNQNPDNDYIRWLYTHIKAKDSRAVVEDSDIINAYTAISKFVQCLTPEKLQELKFALRNPEETGYYLEQVMAYKEALDKKLSYFIEVLSKIKMRGRELAQKDLTTARTAGQTFQPACTQFIKNIFTPATNVQSQIIPYVNSIDALFQQTNDLCEQKRPHMECIWSLKEYFKILALAVKNKNHAETQIDTLSKDKEELLAKLKAELEQAEAELEEFKKYEAENSWCNNFSVN